MSSSTRTATKRKAAALLNVTGAGTQRGDSQQQETTPAVPRKDATPFLAPLGSQCHPLLLGHHPSTTGNNLLPTPPLSCGQAAPPTPRSADPAKQDFSCQPTWLSYDWNAVPGCPPGRCPLAQERIKVYRQKGARQRVSTAGRQHPTKPGEVRLSWAGCMEEQGNKWPPGQRNLRKESKTTPDRHLPLLSVPRRTHRNHAQALRSLSRGFLLSLRWSPRESLPEG